MPAPDLLVTALIGTAMAAYLLSAAALAAGRRRFGLAFFSAGWMLNAALVVVNALACGQPPLGSMYHVLIFLSLCFLPMFLTLEFREGLDRLDVYFAVASAIPLAGTLFMERDVLWRRVPALQSPWFMPHVAAYIISYSLAAVAFIVTIAGILKHWLFRRDDTPDQEASHQILRLAFPFMTFGLLSGALWAEEAWGRYWSWDSKETWSLVTWMLYAVHFHCMSGSGLRRWSRASHILAFLALLTTFLLVNLLPKLASALHSYAT